MALKQGSARESGKKKGSPGKLSGAPRGGQTESRLGSINREPRATANRDLSRGGEKSAGSVSPQRGKRRLASPPPPGRAKGWDTHARRGDDIEMPPEEDIS